MIIKIFQRRWREHKAKARKRVTIRSNTDDEDEDECEEDEDDDEFEKNEDEDDFELWVIILTFCEILTRQLDCKSVSFNISGRTGEGRVGYGSGT